MFLDYQRPGAKPRDWISWLVYSVLGCFLLVIVTEVFAPHMGPSFGPVDPVTAAKLDIYNIGLGLAQFKTANGRYPTTAEGLQALVQKPAGANLPNWNQIFETLPVDPWGNPYEYKQLLGATKGFDVRSFGPDGKPGGGDDISN
jgi:general secretion pathway protein G